MSIEGPLGSFDGLKIIQSEEVMPGYRRTDPGGIIINYEDYERLRLKTPEEVLLALGQMPEEFEDEPEN